MSLKLLIDKVTQIRLEIQFKRRKKNPELSFSNNYGFADLIDLTIESV